MQAVVELSRQYGRVPVKRAVYPDKTGTIEIEKVEKT
jgi:hypothetical protein